MNSVLITGGSGLIGTHITESLIRKGYAVSHLTRKKAGRDKNVKEFEWDLRSKFIEAGALEHDFIIHLAGASIAGKRWSEEWKKELWSSRVDTSRFLHQCIKEQGVKPRAFISASAIGYYGSTLSTHPHIETDPPGNDFLARLCVAWESSAKEFERSDIRSVSIRTPIVLAKNGGALTPMKTVAKLWIAAPFGTGNQIMNWVHLDDLVNGYIFAIENSSIRGSYNVTPGENPTNKEFMQTLCEVVGTKMILPPIPEFILRIALGEIAGVVTKGVAVSGDKVRKSGFHFRFSDLEEALRKCI